MTPFVDDGAEVTTLNYRSAVGPGDKYDIIGALQFHVMVEEGLRDYHNLLDIGCGSLRGGRLFIPYLRPNRYFGIEPDAFLVREGIVAELGEDILEVKNPIFLFCDDFELKAFRTTFDFILAQSIFTHAAQWMIHKCLEHVRATLESNGKFIFTYFDGATDYQGSEWAQRPDARYTVGWMKQVCAEHGLSYVKLRYKHPSGQIWVRAMHK